MSRRLPAAERRAQLIGASLRAFARHGYRGATTRAIAAEADVAEALLYRYFDSKEALFIAGLEETAERITSVTESLIAAAADPASAVRAVVAFSASIIGRDATLAKMVFNVNAELDDPAILTAYLPYQNRIIEIIAGAITRWREQGLLRPGPSPDEIAWMLMGVFQSLALRRQSGQLDAFDGDAVAALLGRLLGCDDVVPS